MPVGMTTSQRNTRPLSIPQFHLNRDKSRSLSVSTSSDSHSSNTLRRVIIARTGSKHIHQGCNDDRIYLNLISSRNSSPISESAEISENPVEESSPSVEYETKSLLFQPSLAAGGEVDLSRTFSLTNHGTYSFGGKKSQPIIFSKAQSLPRSQHPISLKCNKDSFGNPGLVNCQPVTVPQCQQPNSPRSFQKPEVIQLVSTLELRLKAVEQGQGLISQSHTTDNREKLLSNNVNETVPK
ncbi:hypothetical protein GcM1_249119 [Golovinomyces cichoracearum]|uniref:Uncharacterized protein n=1 Tax=Golovinomyces cichoracearum TaxID=62708 RepID=A0A420IBX3_9PEZI|nr:hypothetical protein GcM1_249119 [Golovinomyces cichoracearum]